MENENNEVIVFAKKEGERNIEVIYKDIITLYRFSKVSYIKHESSVIDTYYGYFIFDSDDFIRAQFASDSVLTFEKG